MKAFKFSSNVFLNALLMSFLFFGFLSNAYSGKAEQTDIQKTLISVYEKYKNEHGGENPDYIPELFKVDPHLFGIVIITSEGKIESIGDVDVPFAIECLVKPFLYGLALKDSGTVINKKVGLNSTGYEFNSVLSIDKKSDHRQNPMTNAGAIQLSSFVQGKNATEKWKRILGFIRKMTDETPDVGKAVYHSESISNYKNRSITNLLSLYGMVKGNGEEALDLYTKACSIMMTAKQVAFMGAILANWGTHPLTGEQILTPEQTRSILSQMALNGFYEHSGEWWTEVGIPSKSGVGGGILSIVPGKMAIVVFSPPLDKIGNSVKGQKVIKELSKQWNLHSLGKEQARNNFPFWPVPKK